MLVQQIMIWDIKWISMNDLALGASQGPQSNTHIRVRELNNQSANNIVDWGYESHYMKSITKQNSKLVIRMPNPKENQNKCYYGISVKLMQKNHVG